MCGIAGWFSQNDALADEKRLLVAMTDCLAHRGPDGAGYRLYPKCGLGHRRLAVVDVHQGIQPMLSADGYSSLLFNGELYNYIELKDELKRNGAVFTTQSDTEVLLNGLARYGINFASRINGQYAFVYYDNRAHRLVMAVDPFGEKPIFYWRFNDTIFFASEIKALLPAFDYYGQPRVLDLSMLSNFLSLNYVPGPSLLKGVQAVDPGTGICLDDCLCFVTTHLTPGIETSGEELLPVLKRAVRIRMRADQPVGLFLSGGIDSSLTACLAAAEKDVRSRLAAAFTARFSDRYFDESEKARRVASRLGLPLIEVEIKDDPSLLENTLSDVVYHGDSPLADSSSLAFYILAKEAARHCKAVLTGDGGDELFCGYLTYKATLLASRVPELLRKLVQRSGCLTGLLGNSRRKVGLREKMSRFISNVGLPPGAAHFAWNAALSCEAKKAIIRPEFADCMTDTFTLLAQRFHVDSGRPEAHELMLADQGCYLRYDILQKADRMAMAHGLETRAVYLDPAVAALARDYSLKKGYKLRAAGEKPLLKSALEEIAPWYVFAKKEGFSVPVHSWLRGPLFGFAEGIFSSDFARNSSPYDQSSILNLLFRHKSGSGDFGYQLWGILVALIWMERFKISVSATYPDTACGG